MYDKVTLVALMALTLMLAACEGTIEMPQYDPETGEPIGAFGNRDGSAAGDPTANTAGGGAGTAGTAGGQQGGGGAPAEEPASAANHPGKALYDMHCSACHGAAATGAAVWPESIAGYEPVADIVTNGRGSMAPVAITADEIADIQGYLIALVEAPPGEGGATDPEPVDISNLTGLEVYELRCAACHGDEGQGTDLGYQLRYGADEYSKHVVRQGRTTRRFASDMPAYDDISEAQLDEMFDWLSSFPNPDTGEELYGQYCANCHGDDGRGGRSGEGVASRSSSTEKIRDGENVGNVGSSEYMPRWNTEQLSQTEVDLINEYVSALP